MSSERQASTGPAASLLSQELDQIAGAGHRIIGPGAGDVYNRLRAQRGLDPFTELSPAFDISDWLAMRW
jgi:hypothetical protein